MSWESISCIPGLVHQLRSYRRKGGTSELEGPLEAGHLMEEKWEQRCSAWSSSLWGLEFWQGWIRMRLMPLDSRGPTLVIWRWRLELSVRQPQVWTEFSTLSSSLLLMPGYSAQHPRVWKLSLHYISRGRLLMMLRCFAMFLDSSKLLEGFSCIGLKPSSLPPFLTLELCYIA